MEENHSKNRKWHPKPLKKHYLEKVFASRFRQVEKPYKTNGKQVFEKSGNTFEIPYKTNAKCMKCAPKWENGLQEHWKSIRFSLWITCWFSISRNLIKPMGSHTFSSTLPELRQASKTEGPARTGSPGQLIQILVKTPRPFSEARWRTRGEGFWLGHRLEQNDRLSSRMDPPREAAILRQVGAEIEGDGKREGDHFTSVSLTPPLTILTGYST